MADIFISYSRRDIDRVMPLIDYLKSNGSSVWCDQDIAGADEWAQDIFDAIRNCQICLVMLSGASARSDEVRKEVSLAAEEKKKFVPIHLEDCKDAIPGTMRYHFAGTQQITMRDARDFPEILSQISNWVHDGERAIAKIRVSIDRLSQELDTETTIGYFPVLETTQIVCRTLVDLINTDLIGLLERQQKRFWLPSNIAEHEESGLRLLRNYGLIHHSEKWLFEPTRSARVWSSPSGDLLLSLYKEEFSRIRRLAWESVEIIHKAKTNAPLMSDLLSMRRGAAPGSMERLRQLRNLCFVYYPSLSSTPLLAEVDISEFQLTELGEYVLAVTGHFRP